MSIILFPQSESQTPKEEIQFPHLKHGIEVMQIEYQNQPMVLLQDTEGFAEKPAIISIAAFLLVALADGKRTIKELQSLFMEKTGTMLQILEIYGMLQQLSDSHFLETSEVQEWRKQKFEEFRTSKVRKSVFIGRAYPEDRLQLAAMLGSFFQDKRGPEKPLSETSSIQKPPLAVVTPHIDFERGGPLYAWSYQSLSECQQPDVIIALGVAHASPNSPWVMTDKTFETIYGNIETDAELYQEIASALWYDPKAEEIIHHNEHSLEFQALWLKYLWREKSPKWVPILCSSLEKYCENCTPASLPHIEEAIQKIGLILKKYIEQGKKIMILTGIDLSHVGPKFGNDIEFKDENEAIEFWKKLEELDRNTLRLAMSLEAEKLYLTGIGENSWRNICGLTSLYTLVRWLSIITNNTPVESTLLAYDQSEDIQGGMVSFASMIFRNL